MCMREMVTVISLKSSSPRIMVMTMTMVSEETLVLHIIYNILYIFTLGCAKTVNYCLFYIHLYFFKVYILLKSRFKRRIFYISLKYLGELFAEFFYQHWKSDSTSLTNMSQGILNYRRVGGYRVNKIDRHIFITCK